MKEFIRQVCIVAGKVVFKQAYLPWFKEQLKKNKEKGKGKI